MQVSQAFNALQVLNDQPVFRPPSTQKDRTATSGGTGIDGGPTPKPTIQGKPSLVEASFGGLLRRLGGPLPPVPKPPIENIIPLGPPQQTDQLGIRVHDYRQTLDAAHADLVSQLKIAQDTLKTAKQSGNQDAITAAQKTIDDLNVQLKDNRDNLLTVHDAVKGLRQFRQHLAADMKAGNMDAIQQDRDAIAQQRDQLLADIQA